MQMHAQIAHQEHHRRLEVCRAWPVGRVKQAPESTVHAQHVKQVNIVRQRRQMLRRVSTAQLDGPLPPAASDVNLVVLVRMVLGVKIVQKVNFVRQRR